MKNELCKAFCDELSVREVPDGLAVGTGFEGIGGDPIGFYILGPDANGMFRIEDDGQTVGFLEMQGAGLGNDTRLEAFEGLLGTHRASYDSDYGDLFIADLRKDDVPFAAVRFVALLLRAQDILFMAADRAKSTFMEDALQRIHRKLGGHAEIKENTPVHPELDDYPADVLITSEKSVPVAVMFGTSSQKVTEALLLQHMIQYEFKLGVNVVALIETEKSISDKARRRASNRLAAVTYYRHDEEAAIDRIAQELRPIH